MITIKDIAKAAGVAQGTVSNVLNGKGNVSSEKIKRVLDAVTNLGYIPNEKAKLLRKGQTDTLAMILPNLRSHQYNDFYFHFKNHAEDNGFSVAVYISNDNEELENAVLQELRSLKPMGIATFSTLLAANGLNPYLNEKGVPFENLVFAEREPGFSASFIGFDFAKAGLAMAEKAIEMKYTSIFLLTSRLELTHQQMFYEAFMAAMKKKNCRVHTVQTDDFRKSQNIMHIFSDISPQAIIISDYALAESVKDMNNALFPECKMEIYTVSPVFTMPETDFHKYELDYRHLGKACAELLIKQSARFSRVQNQILENTGFRTWFPHSENDSASSVLDSSESVHSDVGSLESVNSDVNSSNSASFAVKSSNLTSSSAISSAKNLALKTFDKNPPLNILTLDSPSAYIMRNLSRLYTQKTGIPINVTIYAYDEIYEAFSYMGQDSVFDIFRLDVSWLSWFAEKILLPLDVIDPKISDSLGDFLEGTEEHFSRIHGRIYALPSSPSVQMLFYRKDLFEDPMLRRIYYERYKTELVPPTSFQEFNHIAAFFTKRNNPLSPVDYGATITLGSNGVAGSEYLARLFSHQDHLYNEKGQVRLDAPFAIKAMEELVALKEYTDPKYSAWWTKTAGSFADGNVAMAILYSNYASDLLSSSSKIVGSIGFAKVPGNNPVLGGGALGVAKNSTQADKALNFIKWICSEPVASAATLLGGVSPCKKSYENYEILNNYPWLNLAKNCFVLAKGRRTPPHSTKPFDERYFLSIIGIAVKNALSGAQTPQEALRRAQELYEMHFGD